MFGSTVGFSGSADRMALIQVRPNSIDMWEKTMREEFGHNLKYFLYKSKFNVFTPTLNQYLLSPRTEEELIEFASFRQGFNVFSH